MVLSFYFFEQVSTHLRFLTLGNPLPKPPKCLLGTSQTLIRKEARYHHGKQETEHPGEVLCHRRGKGADGAEDGPTQDQADRRLPAEDGDRRVYHPA